MGIRHWLQKIFGKQQPAPEMVPFLDTESGRVVRIPAAEPSTGGTPAPSRPTLRRGANGDLVKKLQAGLGIAQDGDFGPKTEAAVRAFQRSKGMVPDGIVGPKTISNGWTLGGWSQMGGAQSSTPAPPGPSNASSAAWTRRRITFKSSLNAATCGGSEPYVNVKSPVAKICHWR